MTKEPILIVEGSSVLSDLIRDLLEATGFSVVQASTSKDALALFSERTFAAAVIEADMPGTPGLELLKEIRNSPEMGKTPTLLLVSVEDPIPDDLAEQDCVHKPIDPVELITRVRSVLGDESVTPTVHSELAPETPARPAPVVTISRAPGDGKIITVFSLKGGVGASTIAVNLAIALQKTSKESAVLVDLALESGALNILLDIMPTSTVDELATLNGNMTAENVVQYLVPHKSGVCLLSAPPSPERAELIDGGALRKAVGFLREQFDYVVVDTPSTFAEHTLMALEMADHIVLPVVGDISSIRATTTAMDIFGALSIKDDKVILVFNEIFPKMGLSRKHAETSMSVSMLPLPYGGAKLLDSINLGDPIVQSDPGSAFARAIESIAAEISFGGQRPAEEHPVGLLGGVRKRLLA